MSRLISIVLPVYNGEKYLRESIDSVLAQTYSNWELLILDDCSEDSSPEIAKEYTEKDNRIRYYRNNRNLQLPRNLNKGFSLARGEYLTWTSDDNRYKPQALERMACILDENPEIQFVFASCRIIDGEGREIEYISVNANSPQMIVGANSVGACFLYTRKVYETIGDYDPDLKLVEDFDYWQRICSHYQAMGLEEILYEYRWHDRALTSRMDKSLYRKNLEKTLLKNRPAFGELTIHQNFLYFRSLNDCRQNEAENPYKANYQYYKLLNLLAYRIPRKLTTFLRVK